MAGGGWMASTGTAPENPVHDLHTPKNYSSFFSSRNSGAASAM
jgi:hypothetical protein